jgi:hypothetical protein
VGLFVSVANSRLLRVVASRHLAKRPNTAVLNLAGLPEVAQATLWDFSGLGEPAGLLAENLEAALQIIADQFQLLR